MRTFTYSGGVDIIGHDYNEIDSDKYPNKISKLINNYETIIARKQVSDDKYICLILYIERFNRTPNLFTVTDSYTKILNKYNLKIRKEKLERIK